MSARSAALDRTSRAVGHRSPVLGGEWTGQTPRVVDYRQTTVAHPAPLSRAKVDHDARPWAAFAPLLKPCAQRRATAAGCPWPGAAWSGSAGGRQAKHGGGWACPPPWSRKRERAAAARPRRRQACERLAVGQSRRDERTAKPIARRQDALPDLLRIYAVPREKRGRRGLNRNLDASVQQGQPVILEFSRKGRRLHVDDSTIYNGLKRAKSRG
mgnify:CR=1 FL=1